MDGVLADTETHFIKYYESESGEKFDREAMLGIPESQSFPDKTAVWRYVNTPGFFRTLPLIEGGRQAIETLMEEFEVYIVSAAMEFPLSLYEKKQWLEEHFPFISWKNIVFCGDKSIIKTDYLIDDHLKNLDNFSGIPLMFTAAHNVNINHHQRLNNWAEILTYFKSLRQ
jgi:5'-nucleotidase